MFNEVAAIVCVMMTAATCFYFVLKQARSEYLLVVKCNGVTVINSTFENLAGQCDYAKTRRLLWKFYPPTVSANIGYTEDGTNIVTVEVVQL